MNMSPYTGLDEKKNCDVKTLHLNMTISNENTSDAINRKIFITPSLYSNKRLKAGNNVRMRSASVGRDKKTDLRARYWAFLFENLQHAVDELYQTCETDENISECKEVILVLENYIREFHNLAEWFRVKWEYENTPPPQRPNSLAWEIRKSSPGKIFRKSCQPQLGGFVCRDLICELKKPPKITELEIQILPQNINDIPESKSSDVVLSETVNLDSPKLAAEANDQCQRVDSSSQTDNEPPVVPPKKTVTTIGRKMVPSSYTKKMARSLSISSVPEKSNSFPYAMKRYTGSVSPRKPVPGCNVSAAVFVPREKISEVDSESQEHKIRMSRSHSDSVFETAEKTQDKEKQYCSAEFVNEKNVENGGDSLSPGFTSTHSLDVINESPSKSNDLAVTNVSITNSNAESVQVVEKSIETTKTNENVPAVNGLVTNEDNNTETEAVKKRSLEDEKKDIIKKVISKVNSASGIVTRTRLFENKSRINLPDRRNKTTPTAVRTSTTRIISRAKETYAKASEIKISKTANRFGFGERKNHADVDEKKKTEFSRSEKPVARTHYMNMAKSNSFQENSKRGNNRYPNMVRSKTSIDIPNNKRAIFNKTAELPPYPPKSDERDSPPRNRRSSKDTDGWETVISRSRRSIPNSLNIKNKSYDVNKRFYEPSPSTSLPTLMLDISNNSKTEAKLKSADVKFKNHNRNNSHSSNNSAREVSEVCNYDDYKSSKERPIISNTSMFTTIEPKKKKVNENFKKLKTPVKESKSSAKRKSSKESDSKTKEDLLDEESLRKSKELHEKEISLQKEINELQNDDIETDADVDSDSTEVDQEIVELCQISKEENGVERRAALEAKYNHILSNMSWAEQIETLDKLEELLVRDPSGKCLKFAKNFTCLQQFEDLVTRAPGRALELHQQLSSPSRKRTSPDSTILQHKARQAKAKQNREQLLQDKSAKIRELLNKVEEVKAMQAQLTNERRKNLEEKLKRAEENRNLHLKKKQEKAHDEAKKQKEIAFINELEAQNKRHDFYALCQEEENRIRSILEERQKRQEEKAAKDAAVEERRKAIEAGRQEKIEELKGKWRKREERIDREQQEKERERLKMAREKARNREDRLLALQAAQIANAEELQKKIQQKQENSARRHEENIELIRQKAIEIGTPRLTPYQINKLCSVCNVVIDSEVFLLSHLKGKSHQEAVKKYREQFEANVKFSECSIITNAPADVLHEKRSREKERQKTLRKRCKKIRQRLNHRSEEFLKNIPTEKDKNKKIDSSNKGRILKSVKEIEKLISTQGAGVWPNNAVTLLERNLFEIIRVLERGDRNDQYLFKEFEGFTMLSKIYNLALDLPKNMSPYLPLKCFVVTSNLYAAACHNNVDNCLYVLLSNGIVQIVDFLLNRLNLIMPNSDNRNGMVVYKADTVADVLMNLCSNLLSTISSLTCDENHNEMLDYDKEMVSTHLQDVVSYIVCTGIVDKLAVYCSSVHDNKSADSYFLLHSIELLVGLVETRNGKITEKEDCSQLMATLKATELVGAVSMLYAILLYQDSMSNDSQSVTTAVLPPDVVNVIIATMKLFSKVGELNLTFFQNILGAEGISLQVRHIISYLLRYCTQNEGYKDLLHQVIEFIGFFAIHHTDNQMILQSGSTPTVLQQLSNLPFAYFSNPNLVRILFPTLLACCVGNSQNRTILDQELSFQLLEDFRNAEDSKDIPLIKLLRIN